MKLSKLIAKNVKGRDFEIVLKDVNVFAGDSFSGKTAVLDAIRIALLGYHPQLKKYHISTMDFAGSNSPDMMTVLETEKGVISRTWTRKGESDVTTSFECPIGEIPEVLLDTKSYFEKTAQDKINFVFERIVMNDIGISDEDFLAKLKAIEVLPVNELKDASLELEKVFTRTVNIRNNKKQPPQLWLSDLIDLLKSERKRFDQLAKEKGAGMVALRHIGPTPKTLAKEIEEKEKEIAPIRETQSKYQNAFDLRNQQGPRRAQLETIIRNATLDTSQMEADSKALTDWMAEFPSSSEATRKELNAKREQAREIQQKIKNEGLTLQSMKSELKEIDSQEECPYCKTKSEGWKETLTAKLSQNIIDKEVEISELQTSFGKVVEEGKILAVNLEDAERHDQNIKDARARLDAIELQLREAQAARHQADVARAELAGINKLGIPDPGTLANNEAILDRLEQELRSLHEQNAAYDNFVSNKNRLHEMEREQIRNECRSTLFKKAVNLISEEQNRVVKDAFDALLTPCRQFTDGILRGHVTYRDGRLGMQVGDEWVPQTVLSGTEDAVIHAGLSYALAQASPVKIVIIDELGIMDKKTKLAVVKRMLELTAKGLVDNFFGCDTRPEDYKGAKSPNFQLVPVTA